MSGMERSGSTEIGGPLRRCVVCRRRAPKAEFARALRRADGGVAFDPERVGEGRSAWFCREGECASAVASQPRHLAHALRSGPPPEVLAAIGRWAVSRDGGEGGVGERSGFAGG